MRGLCGAGRGGGAVRLLRLPERARCLGLGAAAAVCRGGVPPAAASFQPRGGTLYFCQLLVRVCAQLLPGSVTACSTLAARVLPVFRLPPDAAAAGFVFLCAALYKARQSLYNK